MIRSTDRSAALLLHYKKQQQDFVVKLCSLVEEGDIPCFGVYPSAAPSERRWGENFEEEAKGSPPVAAVGRRPQEERERERGRQKERKTAAAAQRASGVAASETAKKNKSNKQTKREKETETGKVSWRSSFKV